jgi:hypothetical protein
MHASLVLKLDQHLVYVDVERSRCDSPNGVMTAKIATIDENVVPLSVVRVDLCHIAICTTLPHGVWFW